MSIVLNVGTAHLGEFGSREAIAEAKGELVAALRTDGVAVLNADDERVAAMAALAPERVLTFGTGATPTSGSTDLALDRLGRPAFTLATDDARAQVTLQLVGAHQAHERRRGRRGRARRRSVAGATWRPRSTGVASLSKWRMELHELPSGVVLLNDSYNANPESMRAAIDALVVDRRGRRGPPHGRRAGRDARAR